MRLGGLLRFFKFRNFGDFWIKVFMINSKLRLILKFLSISLVLLHSNSNEYFLNRETLNIHIKELIQLK